jgi:hypothetical protein
MRQRRQNSIAKSTLERRANFALHSDNTSQIYAPLGARDEIVDRGDDLVVYP